MPHSIGLFPGISPSNAAPAAKEPAEEFDWGEKQTPDEKGGDAPSDPDKPEGENKPKDEKPPYWIDDIRK